MPPNARPCCGRSDACGRSPSGRRGGTGLAVDIDEEDLAGDGYYQLIVWDPAEQEIVGGYRFIVCTSENPRHLSTEHYFTFSDKFRKEYLPYTIELGRSFVQPSYQSRGNSKSIYALDNLWDGLGALVVLNPKVKYLFGKVTMYASYKAMARNALIWFLRRYFPDPDHLVAGKNPVQLDLDDPYYEHFFTGKTYEENYRILIQRIREFNENIPPLINAYMNLSPTMRVFDTVINVICVGRGGVKTSSSAGNISASACRSISRVSGKDGKCSRAGFSRVGCLILIKLRLSV